MFEPTTLPTVDAAGASVDPVDLVDPSADPAAGRRANREALATTALVLFLLIGLAVALRPVWGFVVVAALLIPLERVFRRHDYPVLRPGFRTDVLHFLFTHLLEAACLVAAAGLTWLVLHPFTIHAAGDAIATWPRAAQALLALALFHVTYYAEHRLAHRWGFLWRFHKVHHSSERLDWLAAARLHPAEAFVGGFIVAPVFVLLGFTPVTIGALQVLDTAWAVINHSNVRWRLRFLDRIWQSPEYHHWHHSNEPDARDKNFGLPLLDTIFGTYFMPPDRRPAVYGIDEPAPAGYLAQLAWPFRAATPVATDGPVVPLAGAAGGVPIPAPVGTTPA